jgi:hypothetical protein
LKKFNYILGIPTDSIYWCSYFNRYVCGGCISNQYSIIPSFVIKHWNFKKFPISNEARAIIEKWYDKPVIHIKSTDFILKSSSQLKTAVVLKRKIHKIFDLLRCPNVDAFVLSTLGKHKYFVLKENLFSLKDLCEIYDYTLIYKLKHYFKLFEDHLMTCEVIY